MYPIGYRHLQDIAYIVRQVRFHGKASGLHLLDDAYEGGIW
jgi:hypothetical protein